MPDAAEEGWGETERRLRQIRRGARYWRMKYMKWKACIQALTLTSRSLAWGPCRQMVQHFHSKTLNVLKFYMLWQSPSPASFKLNLIPQSGRTCVTYWIWQCWTLSNGNVAHVCKGLRLSKTIFAFWINKKRPFRTFEHWEGGGVGYLAHVWFRGAAEVRFWNPERVNDTKRPKIPTSV